MATITTRAGKGSPLTNTEVDDNFSNLNSAKYESGSNVSLGTISSGVQVIQGDFENDYAIKFDNSKGTGAEWGWRSHGVNGERFAFYDVSSGEQYMAFSNTSVEGVIFNEDSYDQDFRVESNDKTHMLFVDASTNRVGIGEGTPTGAKLHVDAGASGDNAARFETAAAGGVEFIRATNVGGGSTHFTTTYKNADTDIFTIATRNRSGGTASSGDIAYEMQHTATNASSYFGWLIGGNTQLSLSATGTKFTSHTGANKFHITRSGATNQTGSMYTDDSTFVFDSVQDEVGLSHGGFLFRSTNGTNTNWALLDLEQAGTVFNEGGHDIDFRIESDVDSHAFFVNGENSKVGIRNSNPAYLLDASGNNNHPLGVRYIQSLQDITDTETQIGVRVQHNRYEQSGGTMDAQGAHTGFSYALATGGSSNATISGDTYGVKVTRSMGSGGNTTGTNYGYYYKSETYGSSSGATYAFYVDNVAPNSNGGRHAFYNADQSATSTFEGTNVFNESSNATDFRVESNGNSHMLYVEGASNRVAIGHNNPGGILDIYKAHSNSETPKGIVLRDNTTTSNVRLPGIWWSHSGDRYRAAIRAENDGPYGRKAISFWTTTASSWSSTEADLTQKVIIKDHGDLELTNTITAPTNSQSNPPRLRFRGRGWNTSVGDENHDWSIHSVGAYSSSRGQVYPELRFNVTTTNAANVLNDFVAFRLEAQDNTATPNYAGKFAHGLLVNDNSHSDADFRVESDADAHAIFVDASANRVGIMNNNPAYTFSVAGKIQASQSVRIDSNAGGESLITAKHNGNSSDFLQTRDSSNNLIHALLSNGGTIFNENSESTADFRVESDTNTHGLFVDSGTSRVGVNKSAPEYPLDVTGDARIYGNLRIGKLDPSDDANFIAFYGTEGDDQTPYSNTMIGEHHYGPTEGGELILYKGNDGDTTHFNANDNERIRHIAPEHCFDTYHANYTTYPTSLDGVADLTTNRVMTISGQYQSVGIGTTAPSGYKLSIGGSMIVDDTLDVKVIDYSSGEFTTFSHIGVDAAGDGAFSRALGQAYFHSDDYIRMRNTNSTSENKQFEFNCDTGNAGANANWNSNNFDFAEMMEWSDGNPDNEDRIGYTVAVDNLSGKIKIAEEGDVPIGVISGTASFVANAGEIGWAHRYLRDEWGRVLREPRLGQDGEQIYDEYTGEPKFRNVKNPDFDERPEMTEYYIPRSQRKEWATVGLLGQVYVRKNQVVHPNWIKLKEVDATKDFWLIK